jgi:hypothetical protein
LNELPNRADGVSETPDSDGHAVSPWGASRGVAEPFGPPLELLR